MSKAGQARAPRRAAALIAIAVQSLIAAVTYVVAKSALHAFLPLQLAGLRMIGAAILMTSIAAMSSGGLRRLRDQFVSHRREVILLGITGITINQICFLTGLSFSTPTHASLLYALTPVFVHLVAITAGDERPTLIRAAGIALAFIGATVVIGGRPRGEAPATLGGDLLMLVAVAAWAFYSARARRRVQVLGPLPFTTLTLASGAVIALPIVIPALVRLNPSAIPGSAWVGLAFLIVFTSGIAYALWTFALRHLEASQVAVSANAQPVLTACLSHFVLGEPITASVVAGGAFVIAGVALTQAEIASRRAAA